MSFADKHGDVAKLKLGVCIMEKSGAHYKHSLPTCVLYKDDPSHRLLIFNIFMLFNSIKIKSVFDDYVRVI